ncbi:hypothetical protein OK006_11135 [Actinobacteria bacterium OK006]|nr:hypothetical protein OK006_11135 [Actinobacteria bacterium OK006]
MHQAYGLTPLHVPAPLRTGWRTVAQLLDRGRAAGLVVPAKHEIARNPSEGAPKLPGLPSGLHGR